MNSRSIIVAVFLAVVPLTAVAQSNRAVKDKSELDPPSIQSVLAQTHTDDTVISGLADSRAEVPLGPIDVLTGYENEMTAIAERISTELFSISQAVRMGQMTREQAEYLTQEHYQLAIMQYQVLSTLHDSLEHDVEEADHKGDAPDSAVVVETPFAMQAQ
jgi:hypothetical protein